MLGFFAREARRWRHDVPAFLPSARRLEERGTRDDGGHDAVFRDIWTGAFPAPIAEGPIDHDVFMSSYLQTYLQRDVRDLIQVGSLETFTRFVRACAARTGQMVNDSDLARDVGVSIPTAKSWISVLVACFQVHLLLPYHTNVTRRLVKTPKLYFLDTGLGAYLTGWSSPGMGPELQASEAPGEARGAWRGDLSGSGAGGHRSGDHGPPGRLRLTECRARVTSSARRSPEIGLRK